MSMACWLLLAGLTCGGGDATLVGRLDGQPITVTDLVPNLLDRYAGTDRREAARDQLIQEAIVAEEAGRRGLRIPDEEVERRISELDRQVRAASDGALGLKDRLAERAMTLDQFRVIWRQSLLAERMMQKDYGLAAGSAVPPEKQTAWYLEKRALLGVRTADLPAGVVAEVGGRRVTGAELARTLFLSLDRSEQESLFRDAVLVRLLQRRAQELGITVTPEDVAAEERRRDEEWQKTLRAQGAPWQGARWSDLMKQKGVDLLEVLDGGLFQASILQRKIADQMLGAAGYRTFHDNEAAWFHDHFGPKVRLSTLFLRAKEEPDADVPRTPDQAMEELEDLAQRVREAADPAATFQSLARVYSEHSSRNQGGDLGFLTLAQLDQIEVPRDAVGDTPGVLLGPLATPGGAQLVWVAGFQPAPSFTEILPEVKREARRRVVAELEAGAKIEFLR